VIDRRVPVEGGTLRVLLHEPGGTLPPIIALPDLGGTARRWDAVAARLAALGHPVAALDLRGHGASTAPAEGLATVAADVAAVAADLGWWPIVAGHGFGAAVSLRVAGDHPGVARAHVWLAGGTTDLAGRYADWPTAAAVETPPHRAGDDGDRIEHMLRLQHPDWEERALEGVLADLERRADGTVEPRLRLDDHRRFVADLWGQHPADLYPRVGAPVVIVVAEEAEASTTRWAMVETAEVAAARAALKRVRVERITGDRDLPSDRPDAVAAAIARAATDPPGT
jgi:pimeloyl-ACP methyl ester carboxylesterase